MALPWPEPLAALGRRPSAFPPLPPEEEEGALRRLAGWPLSALGYVGSTLDKLFGARALRGVLAGRPQEALSIIPGSDVLGITRPEDTAYWSEILGDKDAPFLSPTGLAGTALDIFTDPGTYLTFGAGALTKAGRVAQRAGVLPKTVAQRAGRTLGEVLDEAARLEKGPTTALTRGAPGFHPAQELAETAAGKLGSPLEGLLGERLGGSVGIGLPFKDPFAVFGGSGLSEIGQGIAGIPGIGKPLAAAGRFAGQVLEPFRRAVRAGFQPAYESTFSQAAQEVAPLVHAGKEAGGEAVRGRIGEAISRAQELGLLEGGLLRPDARRELVQLAELGQKPTVAGVEELHAGLKSIIDDVHAVGLALGEAPHELADEFAKYFPTQLTDVGERAKGAGRRQQFPTGARILQPREEIFKNVPEGREALNVAYMDPEVRQLGKGAGDLIGQKYLGLDLNALRQSQSEVARLTREIAQVQAGVRPFAAEASAMLGEDLKVAREGLEALQAKKTQADALANWFTDPRFVGQGGPFTRDPILNVADYALARMTKQEGEKGIYRLFANSAVPEGGPGLVKVQDALQGKGLAATEQTVEAWRQMGLDPKFHAGYIPKEIAAEAGRYLEGFRAPQFLRPILDTWDYLTGLFKSWVTQPIPGYHFRNAMSNMWQLGVIGAFDAGAHVDAGKILSGKGVTGLAKKYGFKGSDAEALRQLRIESYQYRVTGLSRAAEESAAGAAPSLAARLPGLGEESVFQALRPGPGRLNPLAPETFFATAGGSAVGQRVEEVSRLAGYLNLRSKGWAPREAAAKIRAALVDYADLTDWEKGVMRRVAPFYAFSRKMIPWQLEQIATRPGGLTAQAVKESARLQGAEPGFAPQYLARGLALPLGAEEGGTQRYLSQLGLPFEEFAETLGRGGLGLLSPYLKAPIEAATGTQLYSGRPLADLYSPATALGLPPALGRALDQAVYSSPLARVASLARSTPPLDPRKTWPDWLQRLLTGVRTTDVDIAQERERAVRRLLEGELQGARARGAVRPFQRFFVPEEMRGQLSPQETELMRLYQSTLRR